MADYKVQMKQYNGTGFDNILPYASQAETLRGGGTASDLITQARAGLCQIATGSYVGTGVYSEGTTITLNTTFKPKMLFIFLPPDLTPPGGNEFVTGYAPYPVYGVYGSNYKDTGYYNKGELIGIWQESMNKMIVSSYGGTRYVLQGIQVAFSTTSNSIMWKTEKIDGSTRYGFENLSSLTYNVSPYFFNAKSTTYNYIALG